MDNPSSLTTKRICGLDLGDKKSQICLLSEQGERVEQRIPTTHEGLSRVFQAVEPMRIALETGTHSPWVVRALRRWGHEVIVANPRKVRLIGQSRRKNDRSDARTLAELVQVGPRLLHPIHPMSAQSQADRGVLLSRDALVRTRSALINHVRGLVKSVGGRLPVCSAEAFARRSESRIPEELTPALLPLLGQIAAMSATIRSYDGQVMDLLRTRHPEAERLRQQIKGVGPITALAYVLCLGEPKRFGKSRTVGAYFGLVPAQRDSGESTPHLRISKEGNPFVRKLLVQCAQYILGPFGEDSDLRRFGQRLTVRGGKRAKKRALIAVARKLSVVMHRLLVSGESYRALSEPSALAEAA